MPGRRNVVGLLATCISIQADYRDRKVVLSDRQWSNAPHYIIDVHNRPKKCFVHRCSITDIAILRGPSLR